jgi:hypothetical protein
MTPTVLVIVETTASAIGPIRTAILEATTSRSLVATNAMADRDTLDAREVAFEAASSGCGNIAETGLRILVSACGKAVKSQVGG